MHFVACIGKPDTGIRIAEAERSANTVMPEAAHIRTHVDGLRCVEQQAERLMVWPVLECLELIMLLSDHGFDLVMTEDVHAFQIAAIAQCTINSGNAARIPEPWYNVLQPIRTLTATIAGDMGEADHVTGSSRFHVLFAMAFCLLAFSFIMNLASELIVKHSRKKLGK